ncbi:MAG: hypothetical protein AB7I30_06045, partial [Isosphaeraceae bacterium]
MSFGKRRPRLNRANLRPAPSLSIQQGRLARQRARLTRFAVVALAVLATAIVVHGYGPPFTYRLGEVLDRDVHVNVPEFKRINQKKTNTQQQEMVDRIAPSMVNDPAPLRNLAGRLDDLVVAISKSDRFEDLPESLRSSWKLDAEAYDELKAATDTPERRDALHRQIVAAFAPIIRDGVLGYDTLPRTEESSQTLTVRAIGQGPKEAHVVARERVVPERVAKPDGPVYKDFVAPFTASRVGPTLFRLVSEKLAATPTLTYEEQYTNELREIARESVSDIYDTYRRGEILMRQGEKISEEQLILLRMEHDTANGLMTFQARALRMASTVVLVAAIFALVGYSVRQSDPSVAEEFKRVAALCG